MVSLSDNVDEFRHQSLVGGQVDVKRLGGIRRPLQPPSLSGHLKNGNLQRSGETCGRNGYFSRLRKEKDGFLVEQNKTKIEKRSSTKCRSCSYRKFSLRIWIGLPCWTEVTECIPINGIRTEPEFIGTSTRSSAHRVYYCLVRVRSRNGASKDGPSLL